MLEQSSKAMRCRELIASMALVAFVAPVAAHAAATPDRLQILVGETSTQFQLAYRLHPTEGQRRQEQLNAVVTAWRAAPHTDANNERFTTWLRAAIRTSMPGSREALPPLPTFRSGENSETRSKEATPPGTPEPTPAETRVKEPTPAVAPAVEPTPAVESSATPDKNSDADPFRDDPADEQE